MGAATGRRPGHLLVVGSRSEYPAGRGRCGLRRPGRAGLIQRSLRYARPGPPPGRSDPHYVSGRTYGPDDPLCRGRRGHEPNHAPAPAVPSARCSISSRPSMRFVTTRAAGIAACHELHVRRAQRDNDDRDRRSLSRCASCDALSGQSRRAAHGCHERHRFATRSLPGCTGTTQARASSRWRHGVPYGRRSQLIYSRGSPLDGYIAGPGGELDWSAPDEELHRFHNEQTLELGAHLCGRAALRGDGVLGDRARAAGGRSDRVEFARIWQALPKIASRDARARRRQRPAGSGQRGRGGRSAEGRAGQGPAVGGAGLAADSHRAGARRRVPAVRQPVVHGARHAVLPAARGPGGPGADRDDGRSARA